MAEEIEHSFISRLREEFMILKNTLNQGIEYSYSLTLALGFLLLLVFNIFLKGVDLIHIRRNIKYFKRSYKSSNHVV